MANMRMALTVLPVGPRGKEIINENGTLTFALQATAGYEPGKKPGALAHLWPWNFLLPEGDKVELKAWRVGGDGEPVPIEDIEVVPSKFEDPFAKKLQDKLANIYNGQIQNLDLSLHLHVDPETTPKPNFPTLVGYLSSLPGEISRRLLATVYLKINRDIFFEKVGDEWRLKDEGGQFLWIAPESVWNNEDGKFSKFPTLVPGQEGLWTLGYEGGIAAAFGPGYDLARFFPDKVEKFFDLGKHWIKVDEGDARYYNLEGFLVKVVNPLFEAKLIKSKDLSGKLKLKENGKERVLAEEELAAVLELWRVQALAGLLDSENGVVREALTRLAMSLPQAKKVEAFLKKVGEDWFLTPDPDLDLTSTASTIANRLGIGSPDLRQTIRAVAQQSDLGGVCQWIEGAFKSGLAGGEFPELEKGWGFEESETIQELSDRRRARVQLVLEEAIKKVLVQPLFKALEGNPDDAIEAIRGRFREQELKEKRWEKRKDKEVAEAVYKLFSQAKAKDEDEGTTKKLLLDIKTINELICEYLKLVWLTEGDDGNALDKVKKQDTPGRPISLVFGETKHRLVHEKKIKKTKKESGNVFDEVTGTALLVRRYHQRKEDIHEGLEDQDYVENQKWRLVSGGVAVAKRLTGLFKPKDLEDSWLPELLPIAEENVFSDGLLRLDRGYDGQLRHIQAPLDLAYAVAGADADQTEPGPGKDLFSAKSAYTYQGMSLYEGENHGKIKTALKAPPLRYGDWYQFAAAVVDAAGGLPKQIAIDNEPWRIDLDKLNEYKDSPPGAGYTQYLRRQPVGEVNLLPKSKEIEDRWPETPPKIALRAREWQRSQIVESKEVDKKDHPPRTGVDDPANDKAPEVLLWEREKFTDVAGHRQLSSYVAKLEPPSIDEFTLRRWVTPKKTKEPEEPEENRKKDIKEKLTRALENLYLNRNPKEKEENQFNELSIVHDQAVKALGLRVQVFDKAGKKIKPVEEFKRILKESDVPYRYKPIEVHLSIKIGEATYAIKPGDENDKPVELALPPGWFACIDVWPLVENKDFQERFEGEEFFKEVLEKNNIFDGYQAFQPSRMLFEVACPDLPVAAVLYKNLHVGPEGDKVRVAWTKSHLDNIQESLQFVDRYELGRDRWQWRNRPVLDSASAPDEGKGDPTAQLDPELLRLAASGLPLTAFRNEGIRDASSKLREWETKAELDRGFVDRGRHSGIWPRENKPTPEGSELSMAEDFSLLLDDRDGYQGGDYMRYKFKVISRYAPILKEGEVEANGKDLDTGAGDDVVKFDNQRRIAMPYRGGEIKPPKILAILPLTRPLDHTPKHLESQALDNPFLVLVDETWFREYGVGERLETSLVLESFFIGEDEDSDYKGRPYRTGPLPDHWLKQLNGSPYYQDLLIKEKTDKVPSIVLQAFGPFGYTLDVVDEEALANTSAFVVYPPENVGPHFASFVQFRRVWYWPNEEGDDGKLLKSEPSDTYALYTLPNAESLCKKETEESDEGAVILKPAENDYKVYLKQLNWSLDPLDGLANDTAGHEELLRNYRYFLLLSEPAVSAGQNEVVELPVTLLRLQENQGAGGGPPDYLAQSLKNSQRLRERPENLLGIKDQGYRGRILEVLLNGKYPEGRSRLDQFNYKKNGEDRTHDITERTFWKTILTFTEEDYAEYIRDQGGKSGAKEGNRGTASNKLPRGQVHDAAGMIRRISDWFPVRIAE